MTLSENTYLTRDGLWRELDALGEDRVRHRLEQGAYRDRTRLLVEEWLRRRAEKRSLVVQDAYQDAYKDAYQDAYQDAYRVAPPPARALERLEPARIERIERHDEKISIIAATAAAISAFMATIAATVGVLTFVQMP
jgi:hypothetical protein